MFSPLFGISLRVRGKREAFVKNYDDDSTGLYVMLEPEAQRRFTSSAFCFETMVTKAEYEAVKPGDTYTLVKS